MQRSNGLKDDHNIDIEVRKMNCRKALDRWNKGKEGWGKSTGNVTGGKRRWGKIAT